MSYKSALSNSIKSNCDAQWMKAQSAETNVKFAGDEAKDRLYEPKHKKKLVRVLTVVAYIFSVSLAAIMLSLYYVFLYPATTKSRTLTETTAPRSINGIFLDQSSFKPFYEEPTTEIMDSYVLPSSISKNLFIQKLMATYDTNYVNETFK